MGPSVVNPAAQQHHQGHKSYSLLCSLLFRLHVRAASGHMDHMLPYSYLAGERKTSLPITTTAIPFSLTGRVSIVTMGMYKLGD